jgi:hypothetical protein
MTFTKVSSDLFFTYDFGDPGSDPGYGGPPWTDHGRGGEALPQYAAYRIQHRFLPPWHWEGEESLGELTDRGFGQKIDVFWPAVMNGGDGVLVCVNEVCEPWRMKGGGGRSSGGERSGLSAPFVPIGWWEKAIPGRGAVDVGDKSMSIQFASCVISGVGKMDGIGADMVSVQYRKSRGHSKAWRHWW